MLTAPKKTWAVGGFLKFTSWWLLLSKAERKVLRKAPRFLGAIG